MSLLGNRSALCVLPTGCGKTVIFSKIAEEAIRKNPNVKILVLLNKTSLASQTRDKLSQFVDHEMIGMVCGTFAENVVSAVTPATIQSIHKTDEIFDLIIIDECHNVNLGGGRYIDFIHKQTEQNPNLKIIGFTATPFRASSGYIYGNYSLFKEKTFEKELEEMIESGALVRPISVRPPNQHDTKNLKVVRGDFDIKQLNAMTEDKVKSSSQITDALSRIADRQKIVWSCSSIKHCENVLDDLKRLGESAVCIHSKMDQFERDMSIDSFERGSARHLVFVTIVSEGYDYPPIDCVVLLRPMRSPGMFRQTVGRGLRPFGEKKDCLVLDYGKVIESCGSLSSVVNFRGNKLVVSPAKDKTCKKCLTVNKLSNLFCEFCNEPFKTEERKVELERKPSNVDILEKKPPPEVFKEFNVRGVSLGDYVSRSSGKPGKLITFFVDSVVPSEVTLYFPNHYAKKYYEFLHIKNKLFDSGKMIAPEKIFLKKNGPFYELLRMKFRDQSVGP